MITIAEAAANVGRLVIYKSYAQERGLDKSPAEEGVITSVNQHFVFVRYGRQVNGTATNPEDLTFSVATEEERNANQ